MFNETVGSSETVGSNETMGSSSGQQRGDQIPGSEGLTLGPHLPCETNKKSNQSSAQRACTNTKSQAELRASVISLCTPWTETV